MPSRSSSLLAQAALVAVGIAAYHFAFASRRSSGPVVSGASEDELAALRRDVDALKTRGPATGDSGAGVSPRRVDALGDRLAALEARLIPSSAEAGAKDAAHLPSGVGERAGTWTEDQIASLRAMMDEVELRRTMDHETASYRDLVRRVAPTIASADEATTVSLLTGFMRKVRGIFVNGSAGNTEEERAASNAKAAAERTKLLQDLSTFLSKDVVDRIAQNIPDFVTPPGHTPPTGR